MTWYDAKLCVPSKESKVKVIFNDGTQGVAFYKQMVPGHPGYECKYGLDRKESERTIPAGFFKRRYKTKPLNNVVKWSY